MAKLFPDEYFHIGGDEVDPKQWNSNSRIQAFMRKNGIADDKALQTYFNKRLLKIVTKHGKHMEGWDEILEPSLPKNIVIQSWRGQESLWQAAKLGYQGILSAGYYLDLNYPASYHYSIDPMKIPEPAPNRDEEENQTASPKGPKPGTQADLTPAQQKLILGGEAAMWEELTPPEILDMKLWPRLAAISERFWSPESVTDTANMYARLRLVNRWLQWSGLQQQYNPELMRMRLAGTFPVHPLDVFASVLEPVRGYSRHAENYTIFSSFNLLIDSIPPESETARNFRDAVDAYLASPKSGTIEADLRKELNDWALNAVEVRPMLEKNSLLNEDLPLADSEAALSKAGLEALAYFDGTSKPDSNWKQDTLAAVKRAGQRQANMRNLTAPAIQKLVEAVH